MKADKVLVSHKAAFSPLNSVMALNKKLVWYLESVAVGKLGTDLFLVGYQCDLTMLWLLWSSFMLIDKLVGNRLLHNL